MRVLLIFLAALLFLYHETAAYPPTEFPVNWTSVTGDDIGRDLNSPYLGLCVCDKTYGLCDPNCCCDPDCTDDSLEYFTECLLQQFGYPPYKYCVEENPATQIAKINIKNTVKIPGRGGATCIVRTNNPSDIFQYYKVPDSVELPASVTSYVTEKQGLEIGQLIGLLKYTKINEDYAYRNYEILSIPTQNTRGGCSMTGKPVPFLSPLQKVSCAANGEQICARFPLQHYYNIFVDSNSTFAPVTVRLFDTSGNLLESFEPTDFPSTFSLLNDDGVCQHAVVSVRGILEYNSTMIVRGRFDIGITDVKATQFYPVSYEVGFVTEGETVPANIFSGSPGYVAGNRIRGGTKVTQEDTDKTAIAERRNGFSVPSGGRHCDQYNFQTVRMKYDVISSGCFFTLSERQLQAACETGTESFIRQILAGGDEASSALIDYVASTNDALINDTSSWIQIKGLDVEDTPGIYDPVRRRCDNVTIGVKYSVVTASAGVVFNPQPVVVGVFAEFLRGSWGIRNATDFSLDATGTQHAIFKVEFSNIAKQDKLSKKITAPPILPRVGSDLFYPF